MRHWVLGLLVWMAIGAAFLTLPPSQAEAQEKDSGISHVELSLYSLENDRLLYRGNRTVEEMQGRVTVSTVYTTPAGKPIQETVAIFEKLGLVPVSYSLKDLRSGEMESLIRAGDNIEFLYRENRDEDEDDETEDWEPGTLFTGTVVDFMLAQWVALLEGQELDFPFLVPSRLDVYSFRVVRDEKESLKTKDHVVIRMEPDSFLVRALVDPMFFEFPAKEPRRLLEFRGRSSIKDQAGEPQDLRITFSYLEQG